MPDGCRRGCGPFRRKKPKARITVTVGPMESRATRRDLSDPRAKKSKLWLPGDGRFRLEVAGESHYQKALRTICGRPTAAGEDLVIDAALILEPHNPYDDQAVRVDVKGKTIGYLPRESARRLRTQLAEQGRQGDRFLCAANIRGGWVRGSDRGSYGVRLDVTMQDGRKKRRE